MEIKTYQEALSFIHGRPRLKKEPTLARMRELMRLLGDPQTGLKIIHVTGTNGKGSTVAFLRNLLLAAGFSVGTFTSPYITKFNERIALDNQMISDQEVIDLAQRVASAVEKLDREGNPPTEFEVVTAMMFSYFAQVQPDFVVCEVGIGGLYDSTNIITSPLAAIIATVAMDHANLLGPTIKDIAYQKAGIIKEGRPVIIGKLPSDAEKVVRQVAAEKDAPVYALGKDFEIKIRPNGNHWGEKFNFSYHDLTFKDLKIGLLGDYQAANAALSLMAFLLVAKEENEIQDLKRVAAKGLAAAKWPGRFEKLNDQPLVIIDGAHNEAAMEEISNLLKTKFQGMKKYILLGMLADKHPEKNLKQLLKIPGAEVTLTDFSGPRKLADIDKIHSDFPQTKVSEHWQLGLAQIVQNMSEDDLLLITGSLYFISEVRNYFYNEDK